MTRQRGLCHAAALKEDNDEKKTRDPRPGGRYGKIADGRALRRGRSVLSRYELRHALVRGQLHAGGASQSGEVRARPRCARPRDGEYDAAQRRGRAPARALGAFERRRCRRAYFGRPRRVYARASAISRPSSRSQTTSAPARGTIWARNEWCWQGKCLYRRFAKCGQKFPRNWR